MRRMLVAAFHRTQPNESKLDLVATAVDSGIGFERLIMSSSSVSIFDGSSLRFWSEAETFFAISKESCQLRDTG